MKYKKRKHKHKKTKSKKIIIIVFQMNMIIVEVIQKLEVIEKVALKKIVEKFQSISEYF